MRSVGVVQTLPLRGGGYNLPLRVDERPDLQGMTTEYRIVTPGYLESVGFTLRQGRTITGADRRDTERVVVINEALAQKYFAGADPIGKLLGGDVGPSSSRVVGVVANAVERTLTDAAEPVRYVAVAQMPWIDPPQSLVLRAAPGVDEASLLEPARRTIVARGARRRGAADDDDAARARHGDRPGAAGRAAAVAADRARAHAWARWGSTA